MTEKNERRPVVTFLATQANRTTTDIESELNNIAEKEEI
jgi:hypothetical protein